MVFTGHLVQESVSSFLRESYALVLPTITMEGHPKVLIESFASGTPCIVTDVRGSREIVTNNIDGLIVKPKDADQLKSAIKRIFESNSFRKMLSRNALKEGKRYFMERVVSREVRILKSILSDFLEKEACNS